MNAPQTSGFLNIYKTVGPTSYDCIRVLRRIYESENIPPPRLGHLGTLDPLAEGVLPVALGSARKLVQFFGADKVYLATIRLGLTTDTDDTLGATLTEADVSGVDEASIAEAIPGFIGEIEQVPPKFSAVNANGVKAYKLARAGSEFALGPRRVHISNIELLRWVPPQLEVRLTVGRGTYIRSFARDLGAKLGVGGCVAALVRESNGPFLATDALTLDALVLDGVSGIIAALSPPDYILDRFPRVDLTAEEGKAFSIGKTIPCPGVYDPARSRLSVYDLEGFIGVGIISGGGHLRPYRIIRVLSGR